MIIKSKWICNLLGIRGITLYPFVFVNSYNSVLVNHELIHVAQQKELYLFKFYFFYLSEYLKYRLQGYDHHFAYRSISFEKEAFTNQYNLSYLQIRKKHNWKKYL